MTIWERVEVALTPLGISFAEGDYLVGDAETYPDTYIIYFLPSIDPEQFADDEEISRANLVQVSIYKKDSLVGLPDVIGVMKTAGFTFSGGRELEYDDIAERHGIAFDFEYLEELSN